MTEQEFIVKATKLVQQIVDAIAEKEYGKMASFAQMKDSSWTGSEQTQEECFLAFGEWLDDFLAVWEGDEEGKYTLDHFNEACMEDIKLHNNWSFVTYKPTYLGDELDFWFEIRFEIGKNEQIIATFDVNT